MTAVSYLIAFLPFMSFILPLVAASRSFNTPSVLVSLGKKRRRKNMASVTVISFSVQSLWNTNAATVIYSESKKTLVYALQQIQAGGVARTGQAAAVTVIVMLVPISIFILSQSQILETMASSGLKD